MVQKWRKSYDIKHMLMMFITLREYLQLNKTNKQTNKQTNNLKGLQQAGKTLPSFALLLVYGVLLLFLCCCAVVVIVILLLFEVLLGFCCYFYFCFILFCLFVCLFSFNQLKLGVVFPKPGGEKATQLLLTLRLLYSSSMVLQ